MLTEKVRLKIDSIISKLEKNHSQNLDRWNLQGTDYQQVKEFIEGFSSCKLYGKNSYLVDKANRFKTFKFDFTNANYSIKDSNQHWGEQQKVINIRVDYAQKIVKFLKRRRLRLQQFYLDYQLISQEVYNVSGLNRHKIIQNLYSKSFAVYDIKKNLHCNIQIQEKVMKAYFGGRITDPACMDNLVGYLDRIRAQISTLW